MQGTVPFFRASSTSGPEQGSTVESINWRRSGHGSSAWPQRPDNMRLRQPQDGALGDAARVTELPSNVAGLTGEPDDARITGGTRSLMRRVLGLNVMTPPVSNAPRAAEKLAPRNRNTVRTQVA